MLIRLLVLVAVALGEPYQLSIAHTWDGADQLEYPAKLTLDADPAGLLVTVEAKFWNDPVRPAHPAGALFRLWDYEVVELFLLNDAGLYLEVELGPWGHHLVLLLDNGKDLRHSLPLAYSVTREEGGSWKGKAVIPTSYLPPNISKLNAYAIHGHGDKRKYEALYPAPQGVHEAPNFHRLEYFEPVEFRRIAYRPTELSALWQEAMEGKQTYTIGLTWDGNPVDHPPAQITLQGVRGNLEIAISAPYFGDPAPAGGKVGEAYFELWEHEVVEAFFLNEQEQYLELEFGPHGQHLMLILNGNRNAIKHSLPMVYTASVDEVGKRWEGRAIIPSSYFPPNVTLFNAYAIHGVGEGRRYEALYESSGPAPDFHRLSKFQPIDFKYLLPDNKDSKLSATWETAIAEAKVGKRMPQEGSQEFKITGTWNNRPVDHEPVVINLEGDGEDLIIKIEAPYFGDPAPKGGKPGEAFFKLWEYEVVEAFFLNDKEQYLELEFGPHGQHLMLILNGNRNAIKHSLPMDYSAKIDAERKIWTGVARVPAAYFPPDVNRWNAYAIHGTGDSRTYEALFESSGPQPDFHRLEKFRPLDTAGLLEGNIGADLSSVWKMALLEEKVSTVDKECGKKFAIAGTWDGQAIDHDPVELTLVGDGEDLIIRISAPFFDDPAPEGGKPGEAFFKLWEYEVVEAFFLNDKEQYLELEFGPHGQHLMLILNGNRNAIKHSLPMDYSARIDREKKTWTGEARVPGSYFPPDVTRWNAYAIHGTDDARTYEALFESSGPQPDFHRLEKFRPLEVESLLEGNSGSQLSSVWETALMEEKAKQQ